MAEPDFSHFDAIHDRFLNESARLAAAKTPAERKFRELQVKQAQKEMDDELVFLGHPKMPLEDILADMSDDDLLSALSAV